MACLPVLAAGHSTDFGLAESRAALAGDTAVFRLVPATAGLQLLAGTVIQFEGRFDDPQDHAGAYYILRDQDGRTWTAWQTYWDESRHDAVTVHALESEALDPVPGDLGQDDAVAPQHVHVNPSATMDRFSMTFTYEHGRTFTDVEYLELIVTVPGAISLDLEVDLVTDKPLQLAAEGVSGGGFVASPEEFHAAAAVSAEYAAAGVDARLTGTAPEGTQGYAYVRPLWLQTGGAAVYGVVGPSDTKSAYWAGIDFVTVHTYPYQIVSHAPGVAMYGGPSGQYDLVHNSAMAHVKGLAPEAGFIGYFFSVPDL